MNYLVALTRGGSPSVDLMVATPNGKKTVTVQVKTAIQARFVKRKRTAGIGNFPAKQKNFAVSRSSMRLSISRVVQENRQGRCKCQMSSSFLPTS